jgi:hypothetical protein
LIVGSGVPFLKGAAGGGIGGGRWGSGDVAHVWRKQGTCAKCTLPAEQRGKGEADGWAAATAPGGGAADERGPSGSKRGREERGTDRRDRPVSGHGRRGGCGLRGVHVGRPEKEKGGPSPDE